MATIYKRTQLRRIPTGAEIVERKGRRYAVWTDGKTERRTRAPIVVPKKGKRVGQELVAVEAAGYTIEYYNHEGERKKKSTRCPDRDAVQQLANELERKAMLRREGVIDAAQDRISVEGRRPLSEHVADYLADLRARGNTAKHVATNKRHVEFVANACRAERVAELTASAVQQAIGSLREGDNDASLRTCNSYLRSVKSFTRWLRRDKRLADDPLSGLSAYNEETDRRHVRRELTPEEIGWLLVTTEGYTRPEHNMPGSDRAMVYRLALGTGFRAAELRSLTPVSFDLDSNPPTVTAGAAYSKRRREDVQPIRGDLAERLREWLAGRARDERLFARLPGDTARMLRSDLKEARQAWLKAAKTKEERLNREKTDFLKYEDCAGKIADFHATRHTYVSSIVNGGASVRTAMELARHSTSRLTVDRYSHPRLHDIRGALDNLPGETFVGDRSEPAALEATGTEDLSSEDGNAGIRTCVDEKWQQKWQQLDGERVRNMASGGEPAVGRDGGDDCPKVLPLNELATKKPLQASGGERGAGGSRTHDGGFAIRCLSHLATAPWCVCPPVQRCLGARMSCRRRRFAPNPGTHPTRFPKSDQSA